MRPLEINHNRRSKADGHYCDHRRQPRDRIGNVHQLAARGETIVAICRTSSDDLNQLGVQVIDGVDVSDAQSIATLPDRLHHQPIDVLINNAGRLRRDSLSQPDDEEVMSQFVVNAVGPLRLTRALLPLMSSGSKVAHITSRMGSIADNTSGGMYGYRMSKAALNAAARV